MPPSSAVSETAKRILFLLVREQGLRPGDDIDAEVLRADLTRHGIAEQDQQQALALAQEKSWLKAGPQGALQLTEAGFAVD